jgi:hypothetical protein
VQEVGYHPKKATPQMLDAAEAALAAVVKQLGQVEAVAVAASEACYKLGTGAGAGSRQ